MVEADEDPARRGNIAPPPQRRQQRHHHQQAPTFSSGRVSSSQSRLHNFSFPSMSWGNQRLLRCVKVEPRWEVSAGARGSGGGGGESPSPLADRGSASDERGRLRRARDRKAAEGGREGREEEEMEEDERLDKFRDAMMAEFRKAFDRIPLPPPPPRPMGLAPGEQKEEREKCPPAAGSAAEAARPWNLRLRRAACNAPAAAAAENGRAARSSPSAPEKNTAAPGKYSLRSDAGPPKEERRRFSPVLSKEEIEEDFFVMTGSKPPRRPKKRPKNVRKPLESLFPGFYLTEVTPDLYKITEDK